MVVLSNDRTVFVDVDDTLVLWDYPSDTPDDELIHIGTGAARVLVLPHRRHIEEVLRHKARGHQVVVWSAGGWHWGMLVVEALGLHEVVDAVMCKPSWFIDDLPASEFMPEINRIYRPYPFSKKDSKPPEDTF